jgi:D-alanine-D-alanine ligase
MLERKRIGVIMGGSSSERDVSLKSGAAVADALESRGHEVVRFMLGETFGPEILTSLQRARIDVAFLALHGRLGEDGCIQGLLEIAQIPYTGSSVLGERARDGQAQGEGDVPPAQRADAPVLHARGEGRRGPRGDARLVRLPRDGEAARRGIEPRRLEGERRRTSCRARVAHALEYDDVVIVERFVQGVEVDVGILDGRVLGAIEIAPKKGFYDYEAKYTPGHDRLLHAGSPPARPLSGVQNLALRAARALGVTGAVRVDLLVTSGENEYVLEVNTLPGMTQTSLLPKIAASAGYDFATLCEGRSTAETLARPCACWRVCSRPSGSVRC